MRTRLAAHMRSDISLRDVAAQLYTGKHSKRRGVLPRFVDNLCVKSRGIEVFFGTLKVATQDAKVMTADYSSTEAESII